CPSPLCLYPSFASPYRPYPSLSSLGPSVSLPPFLVSSPPCFSFSSCLPPLLLKLQQLHHLLLLLLLVLPLLLLLLLLSFFLPLLHSTPLYLNLFESISLIWPLSISHSLSISLFSHCLSLSLSISLFSHCLSLSLSLSL